jgi:hypothetical protein
MILAILSEAKDLNRHSAQVAADATFSCSAMTGGEN